MVIGDIYISQTVRITSKIVQLTFEVKLLRNIEPISFWLRRYSPTVRTHMYT